MEKGVLYHKNKVFTTAEKEYLIAIKLDPQLAAAHLHYGDLLKATRRPNAAEVEYKKTINKSLTNKKDN